MGVFPHIPAARVPDNTEPYGLSSRRLFCYQFCEGPFSTQGQCVKLHSIRRCFLYWGLYA